MQTIIQLIFKYKHHSKMKEVSQNMTEMDLSVTPFT